MYNRICCDRAEVKTPLASEFSVVTPLPITLSSLSGCVYVCVRVFTQPPGCNDGSRRLLFHSRQVRTYSSQRPAKPGDTLTVIASLHHGCPLFRSYSGYSLQTQTSELKKENQLKGFQGINSNSFAFSDKNDGMASPLSAVIN